MNAYQTAFFIIGIISSGFFVLIVIPIFAGLIIGKAWERFPDVKPLIERQAELRAYNEASKERDAG